MNRAMHKSTVAVSYIDKKNFQVENVEYLKKDFFGVLKEFGKEIVFQPINGRFPEMLLVHIQPQYFN